MPAAVVTGGASGLGLALAHRAAALGMDVALLDRDGERAASEADAIAADHDTTAVGLAVDVADETSLDRAAVEVADRFGAVDVLVSNVGVQLFGSVETFTDEEWRWLLEVNVLGTARTVRAFLPHLRRAAAPRLAFTTSSSVLDPAARLGAYQASKFAVWGLAETLRLELADDGITVSVLFPSAMLTRHLEASGDAQPGALRRPVAREGDLEVAMATNPALASALATADDAAEGVVEAILAGAPYVVTYGDLTDAVGRRWSDLRRAAEAASPAAP